MIDHHHLLEFGDDSALQMSDNNQSHHSEPDDEIAQARSATSSSPTSFPSISAPSILPASYNPHLPRDNTWIFDTGASRHMSGIRLDFDYMRRHSGCINIAGSGKLPILGIGTVRIGCKLSNGGTSIVKLRDVLFSEELHETRLFSWSYVRNTGVELRARGDSLSLVNSNGTEVLWAKFENGLLRIQHFEFRNFDDLPLQRAQTATTSNPSTQIQVYRAANCAVFENASCMPANSSSSSSPLMSIEWPMGTPDYSSGPRSPHELSSSVTPADSHDSTTTHVSLNDASSNMLISSDDTTAVSGSTSEVKAMVRKSFECEDDEIVLPQN